ncbi:gliding motility-associated C-terminal domain-containing protein [Marivirga arenosa]|uniref:Gliding motility-associated C-terminal domain-containing protein n=1 Tax=Marivirga arenosa TaxID=3059076 RepID=A0AA51N4X7_9BACT|nr:gliding motility-associated C-terminal domain-containing protein [Marivirga sp. ABR2-2]WMN06103.1 gliding motility-associated C-terminal domain-containing protein [Marivirga sp. ABR2-2]
MRKLLLSIFLTVLSFALLAQGSFESENGLFTVNYLKGCEGTRITLTPTDTVGTVFICFDADLSDLAANNSCFGNPAQSSDDFSFIYNDAGNFDILFLRQLPNDQVYDSISVSIFESIPVEVLISNCTDNTIFDLNQENDIYDRYDINFGDGSNLTGVQSSDFPISHTYADPEIEYTVSITPFFDGTGNNNCQNNTSSESFIPIDQQESAASLNSLEILSDESFEIAYSLNANQTYQLQLSENGKDNYQNVQLISGQTSGNYTFENLDIDGNFYCVRIVTSSLCSGETLSSEELCTIQFAAQAQERGNLLSWNSESFQESRVFKNGELIFSGSSTFLDENLLCGQSDDYQIVAVSESGIEISSLIKPVTSFTGSPTIPIDQISLNVISDTELQISWEVPAGLNPNNFIVYKKQRLEDDFTRIAEIEQNSFTDIGFAFFEREFYYSVSYTNNCGGISPVTTIASNILLTLNQNDNILNFNWNEYTGYSNNLANYFLSKYDNDLNLISREQIGLETTFQEDLTDTDDQLVFYQVQAVSETGLTSFSNLVRFKIPSIFSVPSAFTPNGDALNEVIRVRGKFINEVEFSIYNRWGGLVFRSNDIEIGWDGYLTNRPAPEGTYAYSIRVVDEFGEEYFKSGVFNLIR